MTHLSCLTRHIPDNKKNFPQDQSGVTDETESAELHGEARSRGLLSQQEALPL